MSTRRKPIIRLIALLLTVTFVSMDFAWAAPTLMRGSVGTAKSPVERLSLEVLLEDPSRLDIPLKHVTLREIHKGTSDKLIIHIQDAHSNLSGQKSLANALDYFLQRYDIPLVLVEGSEGDATLDELKLIAPSSTWKQAAARFLYDGIISGEEYLNIISDHPMTLMGIENRDLYDRNLEAYSKLVQKRKTIQRYLHKVRISLDRVKNKLYPRELLEFKKEEIDPGPFSKFQEIQKLQVLRQKEAAIDFEKITAEDPQYQEYLKAFKELKFDRLIEELEAWENEFYDDQLTSEDQKKLRALDRYVGLLEKAYQIQLSSKEFALLKANDADFATASWQAFLNQKLAELGYFSDIVPFESHLDDAKETLMEFYSLVDERDDVFIENTKRTLSERNEKAAFLIAGGYHTQNLTRLMREAGYSYVVLAPHIQYETDHEKYERLLLSSVIASPAKKGHVIARSAEGATKQSHRNSLNTLRKLGLKRGGYDLIRREYNDGIPVLSAKQGKMFAIWLYTKRLGTKHGALQLVFGSRAKRLNLSEAKPKDLRLSQFRNFRFVPGRGIPTEDSGGSDGLNRGYLLWAHRFGDRKAPYFFKMPGPLSVDEESPGYSRVEYESELMTELAKSLPDDSVLKVPEYALGSLETDRDLNILVDLLNLTSDEWKQWERVYEKYPSYLVMRQAPGKSLGDLLQEIAYEISGQGQSLGERFSRMISGDESRRVQALRRRYVDYFILVSKALVEMHQAGFRNRDLREEDIFIDDSGEKPVVTIVDWEIGVKVRDPRFSLERLKAIHGSFGTSAGNLRTGLGWIGAVKRDVGAILRIADVFSREIPIIKDSPIGTAIAEVVNQEMDYSTIDDVPDIFFDELEQYEGRSQAEKLHNFFLSLRDELEGDGSRLTDVSGSRVGEIAGKLFNWLGRIGSVPTIVKVLTRFYPANNGNSAGPVPQSAAGSRNVKGAGIYRYSLGDEVVSTREESFARLLPYVHHGVIIPLEFQHMDERTIWGTKGRVHLAMLSKKGRTQDRFMRLLAKQNFGGESVIPVLYHAPPPYYAEGDSFEKNPKYQTGLWVTSPVTGEAFMIELKTFYQDGKLVDLTKGHALIPNTFSSIAREILSGMYWNNLNDQFRRVTKESLRKIRVYKDEAVPFFKPKSGKVTFWGDVKLQHWQGEPNPVVRFDPAPTIAEDAWMGSQWASAKGRRPEVPLTSLVLLSNRTWATKKTQSIILAGFQHVKGPIADVRYPKHGDPIKRQWNVYFLANDDVPVPEPDRNVLVLRDGEVVLYRLGGETVSVYLGKGFSRDSTTGYWVRFEGPYENYKGVVFVDSKSREIKAFCLYDRTEENFVEPLEVFGDSMPDPMVQLEKSVKSPRQKAQKQLKEKVRPGKTPTARELVADHLVVANQLVGKVRDWVEAKRNEDAAEAYRLAEWELQRATEIDAEKAFTAQHRQVSDALHTLKDKIKQTKRRKKGETKESALGDAQSAMDRAEAHLNRSDYPSASAELSNAEEDIAQALALATVKTDFSGIGIVRERLNGLRTRVAGASNMNVMRIRVEEPVTHTISESFRLAEVAMDKAQVLISGRMHDEAASALEDAEVYLEEVEDSHPEKEADKNRLIVETERLEELQAAAQQGARTSGKLPSFYVPSHNINFEIEWEGTGAFGTPYIVIRLYDVKTTDSQTNHYHHIMVYPARKTEWDSSASFQLADFLSRELSSSNGVINAHDFYLAKNHLESFKYDPSLGLVSTDRPSPSAVREQVVDSIEKLRGVKGNDAKSKRTRTRVVNNLVNNGVGGFAHIMTELMEMKDKQSSNANLTKASFVRVLNRMVGQTGPDERRLMIRNLSRIVMGLDRKNEGASLVLKSVVDTFVSIIQTTGYTDRIEYAINVLETAYWKVRDEDDELLSVRESMSECIVNAYTHADSTVIPTLIKKIKNINVRRRADTYQERDWKIEIYTRALGAQGILAIKPIENELRGDNYIRKGMPSDVYEGLAQSLKIIADNANNPGLIKENLSIESSRELAEADFDRWLEMLEYISLHADDESPFEAIVAVYSHPNLPRFIGQRRLRKGTKWSIVLSTVQNLVGFDFPLTEHNIGTMLKVTASTIPCAARNSLSRRICRYSRS